ncbi:DUF2911 domain-containing protein [Pedobacter frigiditerrae]|uniref:DUF2911 domain-containing protein n=1 Tax=Pedobacter frigiditerrae TaxID=2530452 RepID=A0A4R0N3A7_9SPHI|nr:DUF2911 domain-containing protein [Pedobacter frigiditerrae]TCC93837.1 DUF2911 domain-containing protein [Pedobacter frigiditerrae]
MKKLSLCLMLALFGIAVNAQTTPVKFPNVDASPMDALYYPLNAVKVKKDDTSLPIIKVVYSRPMKKGREIFGVLEQFDKVWRLGANENTEIYFRKSVIIGGKKIKTGTYSLFAIPTKDKWTIIVNKQTDRWGAFNYDQAKDVVRVDVPITRFEKVLEAFSMTFTEANDGANLVMAWDTTQAILPIKFKK